ncbi:MAG: polyphosphate kinase 1 [Eubacteriales bacterium]|nr:polyphosphate kinase 1 [Eubacteriales bacterium]
MGRQSPYINRELSWLDFNGRVLEEAKDKNNPLLERLKFLSIFCSNLDEFFMVRVGGLFDQSLTGLLGEDTITGMTPENQLKEIFVKARNMITSYNEIQQSLFSELRKIDIKQIEPERLSTRNVKILQAEFIRTTKPLLSTIIVDGKHPFPYLPNKAVFHAARLRGKNSEKLGLMLFPEAAGKIVFLDTDDLSYFLVEDIAKKFAADMFPKHEVLEVGKFHVTHNADVVLDDDVIQNENNFRQAMQQILEQRKRLMPVRLETDLSVTSPLSQELASRLNLKPEQVFSQTGPLDMSVIWKVVDAAKAKGYAGHFFPDMKSVYVPGLIRGESVIRQVKSNDYLMIHPYVNFDAVLALLREAAYDDTVIAIRQTLYRVSGDSEVVKYLVAAAENGKEVTVLVELKARFDEANNIGWAAKLEDAGCRVIYGRDYLKIHSKLLLVTRNSPKGLRYTAHISTGNYNEKTANLYTDIGILTSNEDIAGDIILFFRELGTGITGEEYRLFDVSPNGIRQKLYDLIDQEIVNLRQYGRGRIVIKINALADKDMIDHLVKASKAGVKIDLIVRGICCLKAGIPGVTENIRVISVVGRYLEHSRVYWFLGGGDEQLFISSADLMTRNLDRRMEVLCPVLDKAIAKRIKDTVFTLLKDITKGRVMQPDGSYLRLDIEDGIENTQMVQYAKCALDYKKQLPQKRKHLPKSFRHMVGGALIRLGRRISPGASPY